MFYWGIALMTEKKMSKNVRFSFFHEIYNFSDFGKRNCSIKTAQFTTLWFVSDSLLPSIWKNRYYWKSTILGQQCQHRQFARQKLDKFNQWHFQGSTWENSGKRLTKLLSDLFPAQFHFWQIKIDAYTIPFEAPPKILFKTPALPYCQLLKNAKLVPFFALVKAELKKYGNFPLECPILHGRYEMYNLSFTANLGLPKNLVHFVRVKGVDEFGKVPKPILKYEVYGKFV
jgi:Protein of unknown function (DUF1091)